MDNSAALVLAIALIVIMVGMGLSLTLADFKRVLQYPKAVAVGFLNQIVLLPLIGFGLAKALGADPVVAIGLMTLAACPGGATSNLVTHLAKGDTALSVTLTALNSLVAILSIPLILSFSLSQFLGESTTVAAPIGTIIGSLFVIIVIPMSIGMLVKRFASSFAEKMDKPVRIASALLLVLVIVGLLIRERENIIEYFRSALLISFLLNVLTMTVGFFSARLSRLPFRQALTICIESGNQNGTLAISLAAVSLGRPDFAIVAAVYGLVMYPTALLPISIGNRRAKRVPKGIA